MPSGNLVVIDAGYLGAWSGTEEPTATDLPLDDEDLRKTVDTAVDLRVVGPDAKAAARGLGLQQLTYLYDMPADDPVPRTMLDSACRPRGLDARLEQETDRISHRERVRRCTDAGGGEFLMFGVPVVAVGGVPGDRDLRVTATEVDYCGRVGPRWAEVRVHLDEEPPVAEHELGVVGVDYARLLLGDADALGQWRHETPLDGLADVVYWGVSADEARAEIGGDVLEDGTMFGWTDLEVDDALRNHFRLERWKHDHPTAGLAIDLRPHSHHWVLLEQARQSAHGSGAVGLAGHIPVVVETSADGTPVALRMHSVTRTAGPARSSSSPAAECAALL